MQAAVQAAAGAVAAKPVGRTPSTPHQPLGVRNSAVAIPGPREGGQPEDAILYFGIIDMLQEYNVSKRVEHRFKSFVHDPRTISAVSPVAYSRRFQVSASPPHPPSTPLSPAPHAYTSERGSERMEGNDLSSSSPQKAVSQGPQDAEPIIAAMIP